MKINHKKLISKYAYLPLIIMIVMNFIVYSGSKIITNSFYHYNASLFIDHLIPFLPIFISVYILAYIQWIVGFIIIAREDENTCYQVCTAEIVAKLFCLFFFFIFPTTIVRPEVVGDGIWEFLTRFIYSMDEPVNLFPSIHCLESWMCFRGSMHLKKVPKGYKIGMFIFTLLVCMSTVFVKQHVFIDIIGGILVVEFGLFLTSKFHLGKIWNKIN